MLCPHVISDQNVIQIPIIPGRPLGGLSITLRKIPEAEATYHKGQLVVHIQALVHFNHHVVGIVSKLKLLVDLHHVHLGKGCFTS